ncbi:hypothetical protein Tco_0284928 [Tanacetum coccineum]
MKLHLIRINGASASCNKGPGNSDDINLVSLRNLFATLNEQEKVFEIVEILKAKNADSKSGENFIEDSKSDVKDVYDETGIFMASNQNKNGSRV